jgi:hypothetical protein
MILAFQAYEGHRAGMPVSGRPSISADISINNELPTLGCSVRSNIAAMIADPADLLGTVRWTSADPLRRAVILEKFRKGESTASTRSSDESGTVSHGRCELERKTRNKQAMSSEKPLHESDFESDFEDVFADDPMADLALPKEEPDGRRLEESSVMVDLDTPQREVEFDQPVFSAPEDGLGGDSVLPAISIQVFYERDETRLLMEVCERDRRMGRATIEAQAGGISGSHRIYAPEPDAEPAHHRIVRRVRLSCCPRSISWQNIATKQSK